MEKTVLDLTLGEEAVIKGFKEDSVACKLLTIGIVPHTKISLVRRGPFGGAVCLKLGHTFVAVRNAEAEAILID